MSRLAEFQKEFHDLILERGPRPPWASHRWDFYREMSEVSVIETLEAVYPELSQRWAEESPHGIEWHDLAIEFFQAHPPQSFRLNQLAERFPAFLEGKGLSGDWVDQARLEWAEYYATLQGVGPQLIEARDAYWVVYKDLSECRLNDTQPGDATPAPPRMSLKRHSPGRVRKLKLEAGAFFILGCLLERPGVSPTEKLSQISGLSLQAATDLVAALTHEFQKQGVLPRFPENGGR